MGMTDRMFDALFHAVEGEIHDCGDGVAHVRGKVDLNALREQLLGEGHTALVNIDTLRFEIADRLSNHYGTPISSDIVHSVLNMHAGSNENVLIDADTPQEAIEKSYGHEDWQIDDWDLQTDLSRGGHITAEEE